MFSLADRLSIVFKVMCRVAAAWVIAGPTIGQAIGQTLDPIIEAGVAYHAVARGETVYRVSLDFNIDQADLISRNGLRAPYTLAIGQRLILPITRTHAVAKGDTLFSISQDAGVTVASVSALNNIGPPYTIRVGQRISIPPLRSGPASGALPSRARAVVAAPTPSGQLPPVPAPNDDGFIWPVEGRVVSAFGRKPDGRRNDGVNIAAPRGAPVRAAQAGVIAYADSTIPGLGNLVLIKHQGGFITAYAHNQTQLVTRGEIVARGQVIARVGSTGRAETPQLHFEIRRSGTAIDPEDLLSGR